jgi:anaerobic selenocysteine-containing dehydrogenase
MAEEIETPGEGQVRALITLAGNPALSTPNSQRLQRSLGTLEFMVSVDIYLNETTRYANVILPPPPSLARSHYDLALYQLAVHNVANYSLPILEREPGTFDEWEIFLRLAGIFAGQGSTADIGRIDDLSVTTLIQREIATPGSRIEGRDMGDLLEALKPRRGPERILDFFLRSGPYGDGFGTQDGLSLAVLEAHPHGVDLGPLQPRIPEVLRTPSGKIELAPQPIVTDVERLHVSLENNLKPDHRQMLLIGRRDLRSNNSWMHNLHALAKGKERCTLHIHPDDAARLALTNGEIACIKSGEQTVEIPIEITGAIMPGVVSIPHGWGHNLADTKMRIASEHAGVNANILTRGEDVDPLSGNAILNGVSVTVQKVLALSLSDAS